MRQAGREARGAPDNGVARTLSTTRALSEPRAVSNTMRGIRVIVGV